MDDLITFLRDMLAEDESDARIIEPGGGHQPVRWTAKPASSGTWTHLVAEVRFVDDPPEVHEDYVAALVRDGRAEWAHIARHDPARVVADVAAKRRIIAEHSTPHTIVDGFCVEEGRECTHLGEAECQRCGADGCTTLRLLALPYATHPDYQESWKP